MRDLRVLSLAHRTLRATSVSLNFMTPLHVFRWFMGAAVATLLSATIQPAAANHMGGGHGTMGGGRGERIASHGND